MLYPAELRGHWTIHKPGVSKGQDRVGRPSMGIATFVPQLCPKGLFCPSAEVRNQ